MSHRIASHPRIPLAYLKPEAQTGGARPVHRVFEARDLAFSVYGMEFDIAVLFPELLKPGSLNSQP